MNRSILLTVVFFAAIIGAAVRPTEAADAKKPNVVAILADDKYQ